MRTEAPVRATPASGDRGARRRERTRQSLLDAARAVIGEKGVDGATIAEIVERADVGFGSFYNHFESRDALIDALLADVVEAHRRAVDADNERFDKPAELMANAVRATVHLAAREPLWGWLVLRLGTGRLDLVEPLLARLERDVRNGIAAGQFVPTDDVDVVVAAVSGSVLAVMARRLAGALGDGADWAIAEAALRTAGMTPSAARTTVGRVRAAHERQEGS